MTLICKLCIIKLKKKKRSYKYFSYKILFCVLKVGKTWFYIKVKRNLVEARVVVYNNCIGFYRTGV